MRACGEDEAPGPLTPQQMAVDDNNQLRAEVQWAPDQLGQKGRNGGAPGGLSKGKMDESARTRRQLDFRTHANEAFEDRSSFLLERASRPEDFNKSIGLLDLNIDDLVHEVKHKLFASRNESRHLYTEHIHADTCGCFTRDDLVKRAARETLRLQERGTELMRDVAEARSSGKALSEENNGLRTALAKLTLEWYTSKEDAVAVQERMLGVYDNVSNFLFERRQRGRLAGAFRGWRHAARGSVVEELQDELRMLRAQHSEACSLLAGARQRAESLQAYASKRQLSAIRLSEGRFLRRTFAEWRRTAVASCNEGLKDLLAERDAELLTARLALERTGVQKQASGDEMRKMMGAHGLLLDKLTSAQDRASAATAAMLRAGALLSTLRRWQAAATAQRGEKAGESAREQRAHLLHELSDATRIGEHWKNVSDRYREKIKAASEMIGRKARAQVLERCLSRWQEHLEGQRRIESLWIKAKAAMAARKLLGSFGQWRSNARSISWTRTRHALAIASEDIAFLYRERNGWVMASAWLARVGEAADLRAALVTWLHNATVLAARGMIAAEEEACAAAVERSQNLKALADNNTHLQKMVERWSLRRLQDLRRDVLRHFLRHWHLETQHSRQMRASCGAMERQMNSSVRELQCALAELHELRMFKDVIVKNAHNDALVVKKGGGFQTMREVIKQAKTRLKKGVHAQLLDMPGWEHAQRLAEFYGVETKFISAKEHGKQHGFIPRVPEGAKKQGVGRTPRARRIDATVPPRVGSLSVGNAKPIGRTGPRADRAKSAPPLRPMRQQTNGQWSRTAEGAIAGPSSSSYQARLPGGVLATTAEHSSFAPSPWEIDQEGEADKGPNKSTSEVRSAYVAQGLGSSPRQEGDAEQQHSSPTYAVQPDRASGPRTYTFLPDGEKAT